MSRHSPRDHTTSVRLPGTTWLAWIAAGLALGCGKVDPAPDDTPPGGAVGPQLYIGAESTALQTATRAVTDAGTVWLLDDHGDFVFGIDPAANWSAARGLSLGWPQVTGAVKYHVMARNTLIAPTVWQELAVVPAPDPRLVPTVVATSLDPWTAGLGTSGYPWSFGNGIELAVSSEDANGTISGVSRSLETRDEFPGMLTGVAFDLATLGIPFDARVERGATFVKSLRVSFTEPMRSDAAPTLTSLSANLTLRRVRAIAWGALPDTPDPTPIAAAANAFLALELSVRGACTELLVARSAGDVILQVRDTSYFTPGVAHRIAFLDSSTGQFLALAANVASLSASSGAVVLGAPLAAPLPGGALACALEGGTFSLPGVSRVDGTTVEVTDATAFHVGEPVLVLTPDGAAPVADLRTVVGLDTVAKVLRLSVAPSAGHGASAVVLPLDGLGGEVALRPATALELVRDAAGGSGAELFVAGPTDLMVGDTVRVDADGHLTTTPDQAQATVKQVKFAPAEGTPCSLVLDLPADVVLLHGQAVVIGTGDAFRVGRTRDTTAPAPAPLDTHGDEFSPDGVVF